MTVYSRIRGLVAVAIAMSGFVLGEPAAAQTRDGFLFGIGGGLGSATGSCDQCGDDEDRRNGVAGTVRAGWFVNPRLLLGGELNVWARREDVADVESWLYMYNASATVTFYPSATSGFFVKGGGGVAYLDTDLEAFDRVFELELGRGPGWVVGAGYDIPLGRIALTPAVNVWGGRIGEVRARALGTPVGALTGWTQQIVDVTIGVTFR
jgi:hypothetical protein